MSKNTKVINPNEKSHSFVIALVVLIVVIVGVFTYVIIQSRSNTSAPEAAENYETVSTDLKLEFDGDAIKLTSENTKDDATQVDIYEDYSCPHCADLALATDDDMLAAISSGDIVVNLRDLRFLDRGEDANSTRVGAAAYTLAKLDTPDVFWNFHTLALERHEDIYNSWDENDLADAAKELGASDESYNAIKDGTYVNEYKAEADRNLELLQSLVPEGQVGTPTVFVNGKRLESTDMLNWVSIAKDAEGSEPNTKTSEAPSTSESASASSESTSAAN